MLRDAETVVVLDFETTGLSPRNGDRVIEFGATKVISGQVVSELSMLMDPGFEISSEITDITGITNNMLRGQPKCGIGISKLVEFVGDFNIVAHNKSFDSKFFENEVGLLGLPFNFKFMCSLMLSRRVWPNYKSHSVSSLIDQLNISPSGSLHRAQEDANMTVHIWLALIGSLKTSMNRDMITDVFVERLCKLTKKQAPAYIQEWTKP